MAGLRAWEVRISDLNYISFSEDGSAECVSSSHPALSLSPVGIPQRLGSSLLNPCLGLYLSVLLSMGSLSREAVGNRLRK